MMPVLASRLLLFAIFQAGIAAALALAGRDAAWQASAAWWPITATLANLATIALLVALARREGRRLIDIYRPAKGRPRRDLLLLLGVLLVAGPVAYLPNVGTAELLFGDPAIPLDMFVQPLPVWAAGVALVAFPVTIALSELPLYYGYAMPRLETESGRGTKALVLAASFHAAQHVTLPLILDWRFMTWRLVMFLPFAFLVGAVIRRRPSLLPYLMVVHGLIDASVAWMVLEVSV